ncbi:MAG TPA: NAD(P)/FAD-dependent oxidoreductase [Clostridiaceae bacterium]|nr:NAD(P)/FAD-dependent oxidoreductase [Clostridiaceae bacterium]
MKVVIIGGGPAGMMSAITAAERGNNVILFEKMKTLGRKLLITGKGRCNITSSIDIKDFIQNVPGNGKFLYSSFQNYTNRDIIDFLNKQGVKVKEERGNRMFPVSDKSKSVLDAFINKLNELKVDIRVNSRVTKIEVQDGKVVGIRYNNNILEKADKIIIATGGLSYPATGSTGDGYKIVQELGHNITKIKPSLVPIIVADKNIETQESIKKSKYRDSINLCKELQGLTLKNVSIKIINNDNKKIIYEDFGEMIFTHFGVSGPIILSGSAHLLRYKNVEELFNKGSIKLIIDLKPALTYEKLDSRVLRDFNAEKNKLFRNALDNLLPKKLIEPVIELSGINENKRVNEITKEERKEIIKILKEFTITLKAFRSIDDAIITAGGVDIKQINPKTMESKLVKGLFFAGEIIDVDAYTGGFNLQIAYSTGYTAGL